MHIDKEQRDDVEIIYENALSLAVNHLQENWFNENVGIVAATLVEGNYSVSATSLFIPEEGKWLHAEAAALQMFENQFGRMPNSSSVMVVTLSPCVSDSSSRHGDSCSRQLLNTGITQVRFGHLDHKQVGGIDVYMEMGFSAELINDPRLLATCKRLGDLFDEVYAPDGRFNYLLSTHTNPWPEIKRLLHNEGFKF